MNPERWEDVSRMYHPALELEPGQREAFLREACAGDQSPFKGFSVIDDSCLQDLHFYEHGHKGSGKSIRLLGKIAVSPNRRAVLYAGLEDVTNVQNFRGLASRFRITAKGR
jgi:hypothetical protein